MKPFRDGLMRILLRENSYTDKERYKTLLLAVKWLYQYMIIDQRVQDTEETKKVMVEFFRVLMEHGHLCRADWIDLKKIFKKGQEKLDIILNGDTFKISGDEGELLELSASIYEHVTEQRIQNYLTGEKQEAEIAFKVKLPAGDESPEDDEEEVVEIENVVGLQFIYWLPNHIDVDPVVIYPVHGFRKYSGEQDTVHEVKLLSLYDLSSVWIFIIETEEGSEEIALDLNDPDIVFIEGKHIARFSNSNTRIR
ncbi:MAG TPA: hypothetical protein ENN72_01100 [Firmicutes bacterium]|nr:hypothetical protein [Bacillota bacterium]